MKRRLYDRWQRLAAAVERMPQDLKSAAGTCLVASLIMAVTLSTYQQAARLFWVPLTAPPAHMTGLEPDGDGGFDLPGGAAEPVDLVWEAPVVCCLAGGALIEADGGEEYEAARMLLARLISAEVGDRSYICQVAFGAMVVNRVKSPQFPDTLSGVIYQAGAFPSVADRRLGNPPAERALHAARDALAGSDPGAGALYWFYAGDAQRQALYGHRVTVTLGDVCFYK